MTENRPLLPPREQIVDEPEGVVIDEKEMAKITAQFGDVHGAALFKCPPKLDPVDENNQQALRLPSLYGKRTVSPFLYLYEASQIFKGGIFSGLCVNCTVFGNDESVPNMISYAIRFKLGSDNQWIGYKETISEGEKEYGYENITEEASIFLRNYRKAIDAIPSQ